MGDAEGTPVRSDDQGREVVDIDSHKRADYILERGMWKAVCRGCRFTVEHADRQRASILFRSHPREVLNAAPSAPILDLRAETQLSPIGADIGLAQEQHTA